MKIADLLNLEIEETFPFRGQTMYIIACPDVYTIADAKAEKNKEPEEGAVPAEAEAEFLMKSLKEFGKKSGDERTPLAAVKGRHGKEIPVLSKELLISGVPVSLVNAIQTRVQALILSTEGKPTSPKN
jgi:hypothetical protein